MNVLEIGRLHENFAELQKTTYEVFFVRNGESLKQWETRDAKRRAATERRQELPPVLHPMLTTNWHVGMHGEDIYQYGVKVWRR